MSKQDVIAVGTDAGIPAVHMAWPIGSAPPLPWLAFHVESQRGIYADNTVYKATPRWVLELYQRTCDDALVKRVEESVLRRFGPFTKSEAWVEDENCLQTTYYFTDTN